MDLPWYEDKITSAATNYKIALAVPHRTMLYLDRKYLDKNYNVISFQQEKEGVIVWMHIPSEQYEKYLLFKHFVQNEAAYSGINIVNNMIGLLKKWKPFKLLNLKGTKITHFVFFQKKKWRQTISSFRYNTLIFLLFLATLKYHLGQYQLNEYTEIPKRNFYNKLAIILINISTCIKKAVDRFKEGNFAIRSSNTNSKKIKSIVAKENTIS